METFPGYSDPLSSASTNKKTMNSVSSHKAFRANLNNYRGNRSSRSRGLYVHGRSRGWRSRARGYRGSYRGHKRGGDNNCNRGNEHYSNRGNSRYYNDVNFRFADGTGGLGASYHTGSLEGDYDSGGIGDRFYTGRWEGNYNTGGLGENYSTGNWEDDYGIRGFEDSYGTSSLEDGHMVTSGANTQRNKEGNCKKTNRKGKMDNDLNCEKGSDETSSKKSKENENGISNFDVSYNMGGSSNSYNVCTQNNDLESTFEFEYRAKGIVRNTNYTDMERKGDVDKSLRWEIEKSYKNRVESGVSIRANQRSEDVRKVELDDKRKSWAIEEDNSEINLHKNRSNECLPQVKKLKEEHETSLHGSGIQWNDEAVSQEKKLSKNPKTYLFGPQVKNVEATAERKKIIKNEEFMEEYEISSNVCQSKSSVEATSQVKTLKQEWGHIPVVPQKPRIVNTTQVAVVTKSEPIHQEKVMPTEPSTDMSQFRRAPGNLDTDKIRRVSGIVSNKENRFQTIVLLSDVSHYDNLKKLQSNKVRVICESLPSLKSVVGVVEKNKKDVGNNALWLLVVGLSDLVKEERDKRCKHCKLPITHMCPLWNLGAGDYNFEIDAMLNLTDTCVRNCQSVLGLSGVVALTPPLPAHFLKYGNMNHQTLHRCSFQGATLVNNENYQVLYDIYNKFCTKWITLACWKLHTLLDPSFFENFKISSFSKHVNFSSVSREWYCVMNNFFAMVLNSYYPKETVKEWIKVRDMFDQVIIIGHTNHTRLLQSLTHGMPVIFYEETMDLDEKGMIVLNQLKNKWPTRTLWCVVIGITAMTNPMENAQSRCSVTKPKCRSPLPVLVAKNHASASHDLKSATNDQIVDAVIKSAFSFIQKAVENLGTGSALFVAPIIPQQVVCADMKSQESHGNLHQLFEKDPSIPFLLGSPSCWAYNALSFAKKWLDLSRKSFLSSPNFIEEYALLEDHILDFINTCDELQATTYQHQHEWSKLMMNLLKYFMSLKVNDSFPFAFGRAEAVETSYEVCIEKYGSFDDFMTETVPRHKKSICTDLSVESTEDEVPLVAVPVEGASFTACISDSSSVASPSNYSSVPFTDSMSSSSETVERSSTSAIHQSFAQVMYPVPSPSKTGSTFSSTMAVLSPSASINLHPSFSPRTTLSSTAQVIHSLPSTVSSTAISTSVADLPHSSSLTVQHSISPGFIDLASAQVTPPVSVHSPGIILPSSAQVTPPVSSTFVTDSVLSVPRTILAPSLVETQSSFSPQAKNSSSSQEILPVSYPSSSQEIFPVPSIFVPDSLVSSSVTVPKLSTSSSSSQKHSLANTLKTSSKKGHIIIQNIETEMNQSEALELFNIFGQVDAMEWPHDESGTQGRYLMVIYANILQCKCAARVLNFLKVFGDHSKLKLIGSKRDDEKLTLKKKDMALVLRVYEVLQKIKEIIKDCEGMTKDGDVCKGKSKVKKGKKISTEKVKAKSKKSGKDKEQITKKPGKKKQKIKDTIILSEDSEEALPSRTNNVPLAESSQGALLDLVHKASPISNEEVEDVTAVIEVLVSYSGNLIPVESINSVFLEIGAIEPGIVKEDGLLFLFKKYCVELKLLEDFRFPDGKMKLNVSAVSKVQECTGYERREASERLKCLMLKLLSPIEEKLKESIKKEINFYTFKIAPCKVGLRCPSKGICHGYHGSNDKRRSPLNYDYSLEMCEQKNLQGVCCYRDSCSKAHTAVEKMMHISFYKSMLCPFVHREGYCKEMRDICYHAHKGEPDVFYNDNWENLCVEGLTKTLSFLIGAITNIYKLPDLKCPRVLLITPSQYMADFYLNCISDLAVSCNQKAVQLNLNTSGCSDAAVIIATLDTILNLLPLPYDMVLTQDINLKFLKALIIDDGPTVFAGLGKRHANAFHSFGRYLVGLNIVITVELLSDLDHKIIKEFMNIKSSFVMLEAKLRSTSTKTPSNSIGSPERSRLKSSSSPLETSKKRNSVQKSSSINKKRTKYEEACERKRKLSDNTIPDILVKNHITISSSDEDSTVPDERRKELLQAIDVLEKKRNQELQLYIDAPMIHPLYEKRHILFMKKYKKDFPGKKNKSHAKNLWKSYWAVTVKEILKNEYQCRFEGLRKKLESITQNISPESDDEVNETPSLNSENYQLNSDLDIENAVRIPSPDIFEKRGQPTKDENEDSTDYAKILAQIIQKPNLRQLQAKDETLAILFFHEKQGTVTKRNSMVSSFNLKDGLLYRNVQNKKFSNITTQLIMPMEYRDIVIKFSHCSLLSGHAGDAKTFHRITKEFYWNNMYKDVKRWTKACEICRHTSPEGCNIVDLAQPMPVIGEPFTRCALDLVGPFNPSMQGYKYILLLTDIATKWPEAVPLKSISTIAVATALGDIFTRLGVPKEILSDHGMSLTSSLDEIFRLVRMKGLKSTPEHCPSNGTCEKLNSSLRKIFKCLCFEQSKSWHEFIKPLLFAYREVEQKSTGFSPFSLLYGHSFRGSLHILRDFLEGNLPDNKETCIAYQHVLMLKEWLSQTCALILEECKKIGEHFLDQQQKHNNLRSFEAHDQVLILSHASSDKLLAEWQGPYEVTRKRKILYYLINIDGREREFHVNMLKSVR